MGGKRVTTEIFIERSNKVHNFKYDYSESVFTKVRENIKIRCNQHGVFEQRASAHMTDGQGCPGCRRSRTSDTKISKTSKIIISKFRSIHGDRYSYDNFKYHGDRELSTITCKIHGDFKQTPNAHNAGKGCVRCSRELPNYRKSSYIEKCNRKYKGKSKIYVLAIKDIDDTIFYKVGITVQEIKSRYSKSAMPYEYSIIRSVTGDAGVIFDTELEIKSRMLSERYKPKINFPGSRYECFTHIPDNILEMIDSIG